MTNFQLTSKDIETMFINIKTWIYQRKWSKYIALVSVLYLMRKFWWMIYRKYNNLPPGPNGLPFVGQYFYNRIIGYSFYHRYGAICYFPGLNGRIILLNHSKLVKKILIMPQFLYRTTFISTANKYHSIWDVGNTHSFPLILVNGDNWKLRREHAQKTLFKRMNNKYVNNSLYESFKNELEPYLNKEIINKNKPWYPREMCEYLAFNTIYDTMFGKHLKKDSKLFKEMVADNTNTFKYAMLSGAIRSFPLLNKFKYFTDKIDKIRRRRNDTILKLIKERVENNKLMDEYEKTYIDDTHELVKKGVLSQDEEVADAFILFSAGTDTTSSTLDCGIALIAKHIDIQQKVRKEILSVMNNGIFNIKLIHNCPLYKSLIHEILRISTVVPQGVLRECHSNNCWITTEDGKKYKIPKGSIIQTNAEYIHLYNKKSENWKNIDNDKIFLENFLIDDGKTFEMNESFIPFGVGRRDCLGRNLAMKEIQIILGHLIMNYKLTLFQPIENILNYRKQNMFTMFIHPPIGINITKL